MNTRRIVQSLLFVALMLGLSATSFGGVFVSVNIGPPPLPVYEQPPIPGPGYIWTPGYWAWGDEGYYWVPGTWAQPPEVGVLWTPGYWGWNEGAYLWHAGYWGPHVGFYGGIDYGFGYSGRGYEGGYWRGHDFYYNRSVNNIRVTNIRNVYNRRVVVNNRTRVSYNGGHGGVQYRETAQQRQWERERHIDATQNQRQHIEEAAKNRELLARNNGGRPPIAATERPNDFQHHVAARAAGGHIDRAALDATAKNMPARNANNRAENARNANRNDRNNNNGRADNARTANRNDAARPNNNNGSRTEAARNADRNRANNATAARTDRNVPKPANASDRNNARTDNAHNGPKPADASDRNKARTENARNVPKPANATPSARADEHANAHVATPNANAKAREYANAHENTPHPNANAHENANAHVATPRENNHPAAAAARPQPSERSPRAMGMPQGEGAAHAKPTPAHNAASHAAPAPHPAQHANEHASAPKANAAPKHENSKPAKNNEGPKGEKH